MSQDMINVIINLGAILTPLLWFVIAASTAAGLFITFNAMLTAYLLSNPDSRFRGRNEGSYAGVISGMFIGPILTLPIFMVTLFGNTMLNTDVSGAFAYPTVGPSAQQQQAIAAVFGLFEVMGVIAFISGWIVINKHYNGTTTESFWSGFWRILAGAALVYMNVVLQLVQSVTGFDFVSLIIS